MATEGYTPSFPTGSTSEATDQGPPSSGELEQARARLEGLLDELTKARDEFLAAGGSFAEVVGLIGSKMQG